LGLHPFGEQTKVLRKTPFFAATPLPPEFRHVLDAVDDVLDLLPVIEDWNVLQSPVALDDSPALRLRAPDIVLLGRYDVGTAMTQYPFERELELPGAFPGCVIGNYFQDFTAHYIVADLSDDAQITVRDRDHLEIRTQDQAQGRCGLEDGLEVGPLSLTRYKPEWRATHAAS
jgi:hypothetical protein